ncbi:MAG: glutathione S-transferase C-terminal domain-containing protein [Polyangiales bacterium]
MHPTTTPAPTRTAAPIAALTLCELAEAGLPRHESLSPFCLKAHRALRAAGLRYDRRHGEQPASHKALNPVAQVPVLLVDGRPVADSTEILRVIDALAGGALSQGLDARARAEAWCWEELGDTALNGFLVAARWADEANWPAVKRAYFGALPAPVRAVVPAVLRRNVLRTLHARDVWRAGAEACWRRFDALLDALDARAPVDGFWMGPRVSVADLGLFAQLHSLRTDLTPGQRDAVARRVRLDAWLDRVDVATRG